MATSKRDTIIEALTIPHNTAGGIGLLFFFRMLDRKTILVFTSSSLASTAPPLVF